MARNIRNALELSKEIINQLSRRDMIPQDNLRCVEELKALLFSTVGFAQLNHSAEILLRHSNGSCYITAHQSA